ncbi:MAG TPA: PP2C family protein-serine/threonine phosphatase [Solirubrobacteraceae bacterium]|nr:PP2C family protein-serine/threonine phosphatase [Solirubrobacteraceae bacterium]
MSSTIGQSDDSSAAAPSEAIEDEVVQTHRSPTLPHVEHADAERDHTGAERLRAAERRDALADIRDVAALARDQAAVARDVAIAQAGLSDDRAAQRRALAAEQRVLAARDRLMAERDREQSARERRRALVDREMLVSELRREHNLRCEALGHQQRAEQLARTLQRSLSPPDLPHIAGLEVAVHYECAAPEDVGGDFYDLFPLAADRAGFFLGDVCGKGPEAAAITSLARYTMRTAAMLCEEPEAILMELNSALLMHAAEHMQTCTAVYGQIDMSTAATAIRLAVAGHPSPLVVRSDGTVQTTTAHGTMLGAVASPVFDLCKVALGVGDAIVVCSDGIVDARRDGIPVDEHFIAELLSRGPHTRAQDLVDRLVSALREVDRPLRDDVAIMALQRTVMPAASV